MDFYTETNNIFFKLMLLENQDIEESINDKYLFKAIILAGGPGSGKSFITNKMFSADSIPRASSDDVFKIKLKKAGLGKDLDPEKVEIYKKQTEKRMQAKVANNEKVANYINGMLPFVVESTGQREASITWLNETLGKFGYDVALVFVNTSLDIAKRRNQERFEKGERKLDDKSLTDAWENAHNNMNKFKDVFKDNFFRIDNDGGDIKIFDYMDKEIKKPLLSVARMYLQSPIENELGQRIVKKLEEKGGSYLSDLGIFVSFKK